MAEHDTRERPGDAREEATPRLADPLAAEMPDARGYLWPGLILTALGTLAILFPLISTITVTLIVGLVFVAAGVVKLWRALSTRPVGRAALKAIWGLAYVIGGGFILSSPVAGALTLTIVLAALFIASGVAAFAWALMPPRMPGWGWMLASGAVSMLLGVLALFTMPIAALWIPGILAGVDLLTTGAGLIAVDRAATRLRREAEA
jgi:uncharacterized membrane protein HdeD (DUF308 family)